MYHFLVTVLVKRVILKYLPLSSGIWILTTTLCVAQSLTLVDFRYTPVSRDKAVVDIEFDRLPNGIEMIQGNSEIRLKHPQVIVPDEQLYRLDIAQFLQPLQHIESFTSEDENFIKIKLAAGSSYHIEMHYHEKYARLFFDFAQSAAELTPAETIEKNDDLVSLSFQDIPIRNVLSIIADIRNFNLVVSDSVSGDISINLKDVEWKTALDLILSLRGLGSRIQQNILLVAPFEELISQEAAANNWKSQLRAAEQSQTHVFKINYADADEIKSIIEHLLYGEDDEMYGMISVDTRNNLLIVRESEENLLRISEVIKQADIAAPQILIESRIVTVRQGVDSALGVRLGLTKKSGNTGVTGSLLGQGALANGDIPSLNNRLMVDLPVNNATGSISWQTATLPNNKILELELSAMQMDNQGEVIATPKLLVLNNQEAFIEQGTEIPFAQASSSGATSVTFKKAVLSLKAIPHITPNNYLMLELTITQDTKGDNVATSTGPAVSIETQKIKTQVHLKSGETVVLGGIFQNTMSKSASKVPVFGDLPVIGNLFKRKQMSTGRRELLIFVTPTIVKSTE